MDWLSIVKYYRWEKVRILGRILSLEPSSIYKKVAIIRMYQSITEINIGSTHRTLLAATKYGLVKTIHQVVETGQIQIDWKMYIKVKIKYYKRIRWEATTVLYGNMNVYRGKSGFGGIFVEKRQYILNSASGS